MRPRAEARGNTIRFGVIKDGELRFNEAARRSARKLLDHISMIISGMASMRPRAEARGNDVAQLLTDQESPLQ